MFFAQSLPENGYQIEKAQLHGAPKANLPTRLRPLQISGYFGGRVCRDVIRYQFLKFSVVLADKINLVILKFRLIDLLGVVGHMARC